MLTIIGEVIDRLGHSAREELRDAPHSPLGVESRMSAWRTDSASVRAAQAKIPVTIDHRPELTVGEVLSLHRLRSGAVHAVAVVDCDRLLEADQPIFFSPTLSARIRDGGDALIHELGLTFSTTRVAAQPVQILRGDVRRDRSSWSLNGHAEQLVDQTIAELRSRPAGEPLIVTGPARPQPAPPAPDPALDLLPSCGQIEVRSAELDDLGTVGRHHTCVLIPHEEPRTVAYRGRTIEETVSVGAFSPTVAARVKVNRGGDFTKPVGKLVFADPHDPRGLLVRMRFSPTSLGSETVELLHHYQLTPFAAFQVLDEKWESRDRRRLLGARLRHISLLSR